LFASVDLKQKDRPLNMSVNMDSINILADRTHMVYNKETREEPDLEIRQTGTVTRRPVGDVFYPYPRQIYFEF
jgi:hypothetical protein